MNRLLALEERRALPVRPVEQAVPHKVKLPAFWKMDAAAAWFRLAKPVMEDNHVVEQRGACVTDEYSSKSTRMYCDNPPTSICVNEPNG